MVMENDPWRSGKVMKKSWKNFREKCGNPVITVFQKFAKTKGQRLQATNTTACIRTMAKCGCTI